MWRTIPGYDTIYEISETGTIRRIGKAPGTRIGILLKSSTKSWGGYPRVRLSDKGDSRVHFVHRLVALAFLGACPNGREVNHIDSNRLNPSLSNLEYVSRSENIAHARIQGRLRPQRGEQRKNHKLTEGQVREIFLSPSKNGKLALLFGVSNKVIWNIKHLQKWRHVTQII